MQKYHIKSVCCKADIYPDAQKQCVYCSQCGKDLGIDLTDITKITMIPIEEPVERKQYEPELGSSDQKAAENVSGQPKLKVKA